MTIDRAGIYDLPAAAYHADPCPEPSLSSSIAIKLCLASPAHARYAHPRLTPETVPDTGDALDVGTAAHALLLEGSDARVTVIDAKDWRTKAAQEARDAARAAGRLPLLPHAWHAVQAMVGAARGQLDAQRDDGAAMFLAGEPEQTLIWQEPEFGGAWCRARLDYLRPLRAVIAGWAIDDYKTTSGSANPDTWARSLFFAGYDVQAAFYRRGVAAVTGVEAEFRFAVQESYPPYTLAVIALGPDALMLGEKKCVYALEQWAAARASNHWPGYPARTCYASLPASHESFWLEKEVRNGV